MKELPKVIVLCLVFSTGCTSAVEESGYKSDIYGSVFSHIHGRCNISNLFNGERILWYKNNTTGQNVAIVNETLRNGRRNGLVKASHGGLTYLTDYINGERHGVYRVFSSQGRLLVRVDMKNDVIGGKYCLWYDDGVFALKAELSDGILDGSLMAWWPNGKMAKKYHFIKGNPIGEQLEWDEEGRIVTIKYIEGDTVHRKQWDYRSGIAEKVTETIEKISENSEERKRNTYGKPIETMMHVEPVTCKNHVNSDTMDDFRIFIKDRRLIGVLKEMGIWS